MSNMSYCKFENTLDDLHDCFNTMEEAILDDGMSVDEFEKSLSVSERYSFHRMVKLCERITKLVQENDYAD
jgi:hypothetical protein